jgi:hypothetical protein
MKWLFMQEAGCGWRWELLDDAEQMIFYEDAFRARLPR